jgi:hypothetical protein
MEAFRNDDELTQELTADDCREIFLGILHGGSDITYSLLRELENEYEIDDKERDFIILPHAGEIESLPYIYTQEREERKKEEANALASFPCPSFNKEGLACVFASKKDLKCKYEACQIRRPL